MDDISNWDARWFLTRPVFLILDGIGLFIISASIFIPLIELKAMMVGIGTTVFTLGLTLPIALYYQAKHSSESFKILKSCELAGIRSIFVSRDKDGKDLREAIEKAAERTAPKIFLLGIAFPSFLDPNESRSPSVRNKLHSSQVELKILILDPDSEAAGVRSKLEIGSSTIEDVKKTIDFNIVSLIESRLNNILNDSSETEIKGILKNCKEDDNISDKNIARVRDFLNVEVKTYDMHPIVFAMGFSEDLFTEQYNFGRPRGRVQPKSCIGKHVPVIQYKKDSDGYEFLKSHFEYLWHVGKDITATLVKQAIKDNLRDERLVNEIWKE
jgi:hypothetical protein